MQVAVRIQPDPFTATQVDIERSMSCVQPLNTWRADTRRQQRGGVLITKGKAQTTLESAQRLGYAPVLGGNEDQVNTLTPAVGDQ
ncbi:hypothetical protein D3C76_985300 [compost metagenome]